MNIAENARLIAAEAHDGVFRKWSAGVPYINHPIRVAEKVASLAGVTNVDIAAAYCHDVVEDSVTEADKERYSKRIAEECGEDVLALVMELTFPTEGSEWQHRSRAEKNVIRFEQMRKMSPRAQRIKMVDRWDNLRDMVNAPKRLIFKTLDESLVLLDICKDADLKMAAELKEAIVNLRKNNGSLDGVYHGKD